MNAIKDIYRSGYGPSSSHTIAPARAITLYQQQHREADSFHIEFCGSLALTGKGHHSDLIIKETVKPKTVTFSYNIKNFNNQLNITGYKNNKEMDTWHVLSLGGGSIRIEEYDSGDEIEYYQENSLNEIKKVLNDSNISLLDYIYKHEPDLKKYLEIKINEMVDCVERGLHKQGLLNDDLKYYRSAYDLFKQADDAESKIIAYAYAAGEENAAGAKMVTAPTLGSAAIMAAFVYHQIVDLNIDIKKLADAMAIGGIFGNIVKKRASIAGSVGGCQAEIGTACAMTAASIAYINNDDLDTIERAAEIGIEHHLGLTCDPVKGYVIVPCIERNAVAIIRSYNAVKIAESLRKINKKSLISFDMVVDSMNYTGKKLAIELKETSLGGLALEYLNEKN